MYSVLTGNPSMVLSDHNSAKLSPAALTGKRKIRINSIVDDDKQNYAAINCKYCYKLLLIKLLIYLD